VAEYAAAAMPCDRYTCYMPEERAQGAIARLRRAGDRIRPFGGGAEKKLKDVYIARKLTPQQKDLPVIEQKGTILWAVGAAAAQGCRTAAGAPAVKLRYESNNGGKTDA